MTAFQRLAPALTLSMVLAISLEGMAQQAPLTFQARTTIVSADVHVVRGRQPVVGLTGADFELRDNGVLQSITAVTRVDEVPVDVTLVVDLSGSTATALRQYRSDVARIAQLLRPEDRLSIITFSVEATQLFPWQPAHRPLNLDAMQTGSYTSVFDALAAALLRRPELDRRYLVVAYTDGLDNESILTPKQFVDAAKGSEAVFYAAGVSTGDELGVRGTPYVEGPRALAEVAKATGGDVRLSKGSFVSEFGKILDDFKSSYVLQFHPTDVAPAGWHTLDIKVVAGGEYTVTARRGYFVG